MMARGHKNLSELRNLPVVSIKDGRELGSVGSFLIDYREERLSAFVLSTRKGDRGVKVVPYDAVSSFGSFAVTLSSADAIADLTSNSEFLELFEQDILIFGSEVYTAGDDKLLGFVKDISISPENGILQLMSITNDSGFMSPFRASVPFGDVERVEQKRVILKAGLKPSYHRDDPTGRALGGKSLVPLVLEETEWRKALSERMREELEKLRSNLKEQLALDHKQFFLAYEKEQMQTEISGMLRDEIKHYHESNLQETLNSFRKMFFDSTKSFVSAEDFSATCDDLSSDIVSLGKKLRSELHSAIENAKHDISRGHSSLVDKQKLDALLSQAEKRIAGSVERRLNKMNDTVSFVRTEIEDRMETRIMTLEAAIKDAERKLQRSVQDAVKKSPPAPVNMAFDLPAPPAEEIQSLNETVDKLKRRTDHLQEEFKEFVRPSQLEETRRNVISESLKLAEELRKETAGELLSILNDVQKKAENIGADLDSRVTEVEKDVTEASKKLRRRTSQVEERIDQVIIPEHQDLVARINELKSKLDKSFEQFEQKGARLEKRIEMMFEPEQLRETRREAVLEASRMNNNLRAEMLKNIETLKHDIESGNKSLRELLRQHINELPSLDDLENKLSARTEQLASWDEIERYFTDLDTRINELGNSKPDTSELELLRTEIQSGLEQKIAEEASASRSRSDALKSEYDALSGKIDKLRDAASDELENLVKSLENETSRKLDALESRIQESENLVRENSESLSSGLKQELFESIQKQNTELEEKKAELQQIEQSLKTDFEALKSEMTSRLSSVNEMMKGLDGESIGESLDDLKSALRAEFENELDSERQQIDKIRKETQSLFDELTGQREAIESERERIAELGGDLAGQLQKQREEYDGKLQAINRMMQGVSGDTLEDTLNELTAGLRDEFESSLETALEERTRKLDTFLQDLQSAVETNRTLSQKQIETLKESIGDIDLAELRSELSGSIVDLDERLTALFHEGYEDVRSQMENLPRFIEKKIADSIDDRVAYAEFSEHRTKFNELRNELKDHIENAPAAEDIQALRDSISEIGRRLHEVVGSEVEEKIASSLEEIKNDLSGFDTRLNEFNEKVGGELDARLEQTISESELKEELRQLATAADLESIAAGLDEKIGAVESNFRDLSQKVSEEIEKTATDYFSAGDFEQAQQQFRAEIHSLLEEYRKSLERVDEATGARMLDLESRLKYAAANSVEELGRKLREEMDRAGRRTDDIAGRLENMVSSGIEKNADDVRAIRSEMEDLRTALDGTKELEKRIGEFHGHIERLDQRLGEIPDPDRLTEAAEQALADISARSAEIEIGITKKIPELEERFSKEFAQQKQEIEEQAKKTVSELKETVNEVDDRLSALFHEGYEDFKKTAGEISSDSIESLRKKMAELEAGAARFVTKEKYEYELGEQAGREKEEMQQMLEDQSARLKKYIREQIDESIGNDSIDSLLENIRKKQDEKISEIQERDNKRIDDFEERLDDALSHVPDLEAMSARIEKAADSDDLENLRAQIMDNLLARIGETGRKSHSEIESLEEKLKNLAEKTAAVEKSVSSRFEQRLKDMQSRLDNIPLLEENTNLREEFKTMLDNRIAGSEEAVKSLFEDNNRSAGIEGLQAEIDTIKKTLEENTQELQQEIENKVRALTENVTAAPPDTEQIKKEITESLRNDISRMMEQAGGDKTAPDNIREEKVMEMVKTTIEQMRDEILNDLIDLMPQDEDFVGSRQLDELRENIASSVLSRLRGKGAISMFIDTGALAGGSGGAPETATEQQIAGFMGKELEQNMTGRKCIADIITDDGVRVVDKNTIVDQKVIQRARDYGKFIELSTSLADNEEPLTDSN